MAMIEGVCKNLPTRCTLSKTKEVQRAPDSEPVCTECGMKLERKRTGGGGGLPLPLIGAAVGGLAVLGVGGFFGYNAIVNRPPTCDAQSVAAAKAGDAAAALGLADTCRGQGRLDTAVLILSELKEKGSGPAALRLGQMYDPLDPSQKQPVHLPPSIINAVEFYRQACTLKAPEAAQRLAALKEPATREAEATGSQMIGDLVQNWPECQP